MPTTTIKVPCELRDRLAGLAGVSHQSMAKVIEDSLDANLESQFWRDVARTMAPTAVSAAAELLSGSLSDGLDPNETWDDLW